MVKPQLGVFVCVFVCWTMSKKIEEIGFYVLIVIANYLNYFLLFLSQIEMYTSCAFFFFLEKYNDLEEVQITLVSHFYLVFLL